MQGKSTKLWCQNEGKEVANTDTLKTWDVKWLSLLFPTPPCHPQRGRGREKKMTPGHATRETGLWCVGYWNLLKTCSEEASPPTDGRENNGGEMADELVSITNFLDLCKVEWGPAENTKRLPKAKPPHQCSLMAFLGKWKNTECCRPPVHGHVNGPRMIKLPSLPTAHMSPGVFFAHGLQWGPALPSPPRGHASDWMGVAARQMDIHSQTDGHSGPGLPICRYQQFRLSVSTD